MAKYNYTHGEWRVYRGIPIEYDASTLKYHWFINVCTTICGHGGHTKNPVNSSQIHKVYFNTISEAKNYIDNF